MSRHYYDDPIENFESDDYYAQDVYMEQHSHGSYANTGRDNWYDDGFDLEYGLSSPPLIGSENRLYSNHQAFQQPVKDSRTQHRSENQRVLADIQTSRNNPRNFSGTLPPSNQQADGGSPTNCDENDPDSSYNAVSFREPNRSVPRNTHSVRLRPVSDLPDKFRSLFKFGVFNAVQSTCFDEVVSGDRNLVISAPTGSGKTVLFELAMIKTLERAQSSNKPVKCVYIAPTKALCSEKTQDWVAKFEPLGFKCCELTGDTVVFGHSAWGDAKHASIIVTTCEKWDSLTRSWNDHKQILSQIELFLIDEVHILNEQRGSTLEVVTSRMKLRQPSIRFILVSATVPNIHDVAQWIGNGPGMSEPAKVFQFDDDYRPCKLTRHVVGLPRKNWQNDFQFAKVLDYKLFAILQQYSVGKPILVFCPTRKGVFGTAEQLLKEYVDNEAKKKNLPWFRPPKIGHSFSDKRLDEFAAIGIGVHHAGLSMDDRRATEQLYLNKVLRILVATSTLAVGVNLPAHMVVIKGVHVFQNNASKEYSDLDVMQMLGRAGRPQFDKDGVAIILCEAELELKYRALVQGKTVLESSLHLNLSEHLNSEIGLGTIVDLSSAKHWLHNSFLYQRIQQNPQYYAIFDSDGCATSNGDHLVIQSIERLKKAGLVEVEDPKTPENLRSTQYGEIMSKYYIRRATMEQILNLPERANIRELLETICAAEEFHDCKLRASEKSLFNRLRKDIDIRFEVKKVEKTADKVFLLVQAVLGGISFNLPEYKATESQPHMEAFTIFKHIARIARAVLDVAVVKKDGAQLKHGLELFRCLSAKAWEDRAIVLRQIEHLGEKSIKVLAEHGITSMAALRKQDPYTIETLLNRRTPFGLEVLASAFDIPQYALDIQELEVTSDGGRNPVEIRIRIECTLVEEKNGVVKTKKPRSRNFDRTSVLTLTSDMDFIDFRRIPTKALRGGKSFELDVELKKPSQSVITMITSENVAGATAERVYKPKISPGEYPVMDTRPLSSMEMDLIGLEDDPDFWNMKLESDSPERKPNPNQKDSKTESFGRPPSTVTTVVTNGLDSTAEEPTRRTDGRYDCNHSCKDKSKCRHFCCRDGLINPPNTRKNGQPTQDPQETKPKRPLKVQKVQTIAKGPGTTKEQNNIKQLDTIHERAQAINNFRLPDGQQRLKMESQLSSKRKRGTPVEYDIHFTDLKDPKVKIHSNIPDSLSDDDLPMSIVPAPSFSQGNPNTDGARRKLCQGSTPDVQEPPKKRLRHDLMDSIQKPSPERESTLFLLDSESSDNEGSIEIGSPVPKVLFSERRTEDMTLFDIAPTASQRNALKAEDPTSGPADEPLDEFAELAAWLESGAYEIV